MLLSVVSVRIWYEIMLEPENGLVVEAIGHQFYFSFRYPQINGEVTDEMHLPLGVPVTLNLTSADVIHGFWVPAMRLKNDTVPGLVTDDPLHAAARRPLPDHLHAVLRRAAQRDGQAVPRRSRTSRRSTSGIKAGS